MPVLFCFLATVPSSASIAAHLACLLPIRRHPQPGCLVKYFKHEQSILPKILQKELDTADVYEVPADLLIIFSLLHACARSSEDPKGAMAIHFGAGTKMVTHGNSIPSTVFQAHLKIVLSAAMDKNSMQKDLSNGPANCMIHSILVGL